VSNTVRLADVILHDSITDGPGLRSVIWFQGCERNCVGCHNLKTQDPTGGFLSDTDVIIDELINRKMLSGVTISGGEPFNQKKALLAIVKELKKTGISIWVYSGYQYAELMNDSAGHLILSYIDVLVDGPFILGLRDLRLRFRGSSNQRLIDVQASRMADKETLLPD